MNKKGIYIHAIAMLGMVVAIAIGIMTIVPAYKETTLEIIHAIFGSG